MASNQKNFSVYSESATRAPVVPQHATGVDRHSAEDQGCVRPATGVGGSYQARTGGTDQVSTSQPGQSASRYIIYIRPLVLKMKF